MIEFHAPTQARDPVWIRPADISAIRKSEPMATRPGVFKTQILLTGGQTIDVIETVDDVRRAIGIEA